MLIVKLVTNIIIWILGYFYAPFMSFKAIQTDDGEDDKQWLAFWVVYTILVVGPFEKFVLSMIPFWSIIKLLIILWMLFGGGSLSIYNKLIEPCFIHYEKDIDQLIEDIPGKGRELFHSVGKKQAVREAVNNGSEFIKKYGMKAYRKAMAVAMKMAKEEATQEQASEDSRPANETTALNQV